ncbi:MAG: transglycosylase SLT domain-containing protein [Pseudomonadota bacterium]
MRFCRTLLPVLFCLWPALAWASLEADFKSAREHYQKGRMAQFEQAAARIPKTHLLQPYLRYWRLKSDNATPDELQAFIAEYPDSPLADRFRVELAGLYALAENWPAFREQYRALAAPPQELACQYLHLQLVEGDAKAIPEGQELWLTGKPLPDSCERLFDTLFRLGHLTPEDRYRRLRLALENGNFSLARTLDTQNPGPERMETDALARAQRHGDELIQAVSPKRGQREAALYALSLFAKLDTAGAARLWETHGPAYPEAERRYGWAQIATHAARRHETQAMDWFARSGPAEVPAATEPQAVWRARAALRAGNWAETYKVIQAMPEKLRDESTWRYWRARALKALNAPYPANVLFAQLSQQHDYYGLLALEELPPRLEARPALYRITPDDQLWAETHPGLQRALLLRSMDLPGDAQDEWNRALRGMSDRQLLAAADLALRQGWHDRAIVTASRTRTEHDFDLRYIAPFRDLASTYAREQDLDEAWVYGLIRQESRFVSHARSRVGAQGLMQIMPSTAQWIAKQLGLGRQAHRTVHQPEVNIRFGTYYLKHIYTSLGQSPVLATAGYNAGPGRARRWQADTPLEGAVYVENIPFQETRDYVKRVLANAMFYRARFGGEAPSLKARLGVIPARAQPAQADGGGQDTNSDANT